MNVNYGFNVYYYKSLFTYINDGLKSTESKDKHFKFPFIIKFMNI